MKTKSKPEVDFTQRPDTLGELAEQANADPNIFQ